MHIVDVAVAVIVDTVRSDLIGVAPHVSGQVRVVVGHPRVNHANHHVRGAGGDVPSFHRIDVGITGTAGLPGVVQAPEVADSEIVRRQVGKEEVV